MRATWIVWVALAALAAASGCGVPDDAGRTADAAGEPAWSKPSARGKGTGVAADQVIRGKVTAVGGAQGGVLRQLGRRQGVRRDYAFIVHRGERYVGTVIVDILFPTLCGARYSADMQTDPAVGDLATTRLLAP